jgi:hypothetical protein
LHTQAGPCEGGPVVLSGGRGQCVVCCEHQVEVGHSEYVPVAGDKDHLFIDLRGRESSERAVREQRESSERALNSEQ